MSVLLKDFNAQTFEHFDLFEFSTPLKDAWKCPVCKKLLKRPLQLGCGHRICTGCFESLPKVHHNKKLCPVDSEPIEEIYSDRSALLEIIKINIYCPMRKKGCKWIGMIFAFLAHLGSCEFNHLLKVCSFSIIGCEVQGDKNEIETHHKQGVGSHTRLLGLKESKLFHRSNETKNGIKEISNTYKKVNERLEINSVSLTATDSATKVLDPKITSIKADWKKQADLGRNRLEQLDELSKTLDSFNVVSSTKEVSVQLNLISSLTEAANIQIYEGKLNYFKQNSAVEISNFEGKQRKLEKVRKNVRGSLAEVDLKIRLFQATTMDGRYMWKIDNFSRRMKEARENKITELYSPPLFTKMFGYKVCGKLYLNGNSDEEGYGTHVAFYAIVMKGEYDELLKFPFPRKFCISLLAHNGYHVEKVIAPSKTHPSFQKPVEDMNPIIGHPMFISHSELSGDNYIWDDALYFKMDFTQDIEI